MPSKWFEITGAERIARIPEKFTELVAEDVARVSFADALERGALSDLYPVTYLRMCAESRTWKGKPSTTQLMKGTRQAFLEIKKYFGVDPDSMAFAILGTRSHAFLESFEPDTAEIRLESDDMTGITDLLELVGDAYILSDYKTWGSFPVGKAIGLAMKPVPLVENGAPVLLKSGPRKGQPKTVRKPVSVEPDLKDVTLQLNNYRRMARVWLDSQGDKRPIKKLRVFAIVRDGGTRTATADRGITHLTYSIDVPIISDEELDAFFIPKKNSLLTALSTDTLPPACSTYEAWDGRKCDGYCPVSSFCSAAGNPHTQGAGY